MSAIPIDQFFASDRHGGSPVKIRILCARAVRASRSSCREFLARSSRIPVLPSTACLHRIANPAACVTSARHRTRRGLNRPALQCVSYRVQSASFAMRVLSRRDVVSIGQLCNACPIACVLSRLSYRVHGRVSQLCITSGIAALMPSRRTSQKRRSARYNPISLRLIVPVIMTSSS